MNTWLGFLDTQYDDRSLKFSEVSKHTPRSIHNLQSVTIFFYKNECPCILQYSVSCRKSHQLIKISYHHKSKYSCNTGYWIEYFVQVIFFIFTVCYLWSKYFNFSTRIRWLTLSQDLANSVYCMDLLSAIYSIQYKWFIYK